MTKKIVYAVLFETNTVFFQKFDTFETAQEFRDGRCPRREIIELTICESD
jgi:hypothetical protein